METEYWGTNVGHVTTEQGLVLIESPQRPTECDKSYLAEWSSYIQEWMDSVRKAINQGWIKEEAINKVTPPSRFPLPPDSDQMAASLRVRSISRLYDVLSQE